MKPQRVLVVVRSLRMGGMERVAVTLCDTLASEGHEVHLLSFKKAKEAIRPSDSRVRMHFLDFDKLARMTVIGLLYDYFARGVLNIFIRKSSAYWRGVYASFFFERLLRKLDRDYGTFDRVIVRGQGTFEYLWRVRDPRLFLFLENIVSVEKRPAFTLRAFYANKRMVCVSNGVRQSFETAAARLGIAARSLAVMPNPIPIDEIRAMAEEDAEGIPQEEYIVNVARLVPQKNHELLLNAYQRANIPHKLVIVGSGSEERRLKSLARDMGLNERVLFAGMQKNPYPWMKRARLFVLSSNIEGFGVVLAEALACDTPVVAAECPGGIRDVLIEEQADYISKPNADDLARMIREALAHPPVIKREWVERFEARTIARRILELPF